MKKITTEKALEQLKETISKIDDVKSFTLRKCFVNDEPYYKLKVESKDGITFHMTLGMYSTIDICVYMNGIDKYCEAVCKEIVNKFNKERAFREGYVFNDVESLSEAFKDMKNTKFNKAINEALLNAYEDRDKIVEEDTRKENKEMNNEENRTLEGKSDDYMMGVSCASQAFSEVDKGRFRNSDEYDVILNSYYKGFEICKAYLKGTIQHEETEDITYMIVKKILDDMDELADFFDGFLNGYADATLHYYNQGKKEREEI